MVIGVFLINKKSRKWAKVATTYDPHNGEVWDPALLRVLDDPTADHEVEGDEVHPPHHHCFRILENLDYAIQPAEQGNHTSVR